jgi:hypothetical protein
MAVLKIVAHEGLYIVYPNEHSRGLGKRYHRTRPFNFDKEARSVLQEYIASSSGRRPSKDTIIPIINGLVSRGLLSLERTSPYDNGHLPMEEDGDYFDSTEID